MAELGPSDKGAKATARNAMLPDLSRRQFMLAGGASALVLSLARRAEIARELLGPASSRERLIPAGAPAFKFPNMAPAADQFFVDYRNPTGLTFKAFDFYETVYSRAPLADNFSTPLVRINNAYQIVPGVAHSWKQTSTTTWEFYITPGIMWSDGNELTANDFVETFRYSADP
ncbi:MAG: ABC transporter substrate-binding protein, partial [Acidimicrobiales bacterium]